ncbi:MAG TPA: hypothetical protein VFL34_01250 [Candidatus Sulfotelmatobacter sp.]|nr:hypothetical protein [Candidatus Sulfotelmatobacter sp.]
MRLVLNLSSLGRVLAGTVLFVVASRAPAQTNPNERVFPQSKAAIEKALSTMESGLAGRLPGLEGFAKPGEHPLDSYQRAYFQSTVRVSSTPSGGSLVRVTTKVTAWYADPVATRSGYQLLISNGRIESDLLDQLADQLAKSSTEGGSQTASVSARKPATEPATRIEPGKTKPASPQATISAPALKFPEPDRTFSSSVSQGLAAQANEHPDSAAASIKPDSALQAEAESLQEVLKKQAYPKDLVAVKKSGTPVVATPSLNAKPEFLASMHDEFELLDFNADWVHVRISGLSRGWIWRNSVEMPNGIRDTDAKPASALTPVADLFHVIREETSTFPGDWDELRNKNVKILTVQKVDENAKDAGAKARLEYAKFLLEKDYNELAKTPAAAAGIVVIFDSADGGMVAATMATLKEWRAGSLSDSALWHKCFFDPPETFDSSGTSGQ